jgi:hypothetical protein
MGSNKIRPMEVRPELPTASLIATFLLLNSAPLVSGTYR